jgi:hypothetical protein
MPSTWWYRHVCICGGLRCSALGGSGVARARLHNGLHPTACNNALAVSRQPDGQTAVTTDGHLVAGWQKLQVTDVALWAVVERSRPVFGSARPLQAARP